MGEICSIVATNCRSSSPGRHFRVYFDVVVTNTNFDVVNKSEENALYSFVGRKISSVKALKKLWFLFWTEIIFNNLHKQHNISLRQLILLRRNQKFNWEEINFRSEFFFWSYWSDLIFISSATISYLLPYLLSPSNRTHFLANCLPTHATK